MLILHTQIQKAAAMQTKQKNSKHYNCNIFYFLYLIYCKYRKKIENN